MADYPPALKAALALAEQQAQQLLAYPPKDVLSTSEERALTGMRIGKTQRAALQKLVADACGSVFFHFFCLIDAVGHPQAESGRQWTGAWITAPKDDRDMPVLHDLFYELYWEYEKVTAKKAAQIARPSPRRGPRAGAGATRRGTLPNPTSESTARLTRSGRSRSRR